MSKVSGSVATAALIALAAIVVGTAGLARVSSRASDTVNAWSVPNHTSPAQGQLAPEARQLVRVFVHGDDIYPSGVRTGPGKLLLWVENETQSDVSLVVERLVPGQNAQAIANIKAEGLGKRASHEVTVGVGEFVFYEQSRPDVQGRLIVEPK